MVSRLGKDRTVVIPCVSTVCSYPSNSTYVMRLFTKKKKKKRLQGKYSFIETLNKLVKNFIFGNLPMPQLPLKPSCPVLHIILKHFPMLLYS